MVEKPVGIVKLPFKVFHNLRGILEEYHKLKSIIYLDQYPCNEKQFWISGYLIKSLPWNEKKNYGGKG